jgi:hypothetical protein
MKPDPSLERCLTFINCQLQPAPASGPDESAELRSPTITLSRQTGCGAHAIAEKLIGLLQSVEPPGSCPWTVFDRNIVEKILEEHHLPARLARFMPEDRISEISDTLDEFFGLHPPSWTLVRQSAETILHLAQLGKVILIGRAANVITAKLPNAFHFRLVAPLGMRVENYQHDHEISRNKAVEQVLQEDQGRKRYLKKYFDKEVDDPLLYHLVINTGLVSQTDAARLIASHVFPQIGRTAPQTWTTTT